MGIHEIRAFFLIKFTSVWNFCKDEEEEDEEEEEEEDEEEEEEEEEKEGSALVL